MGKSTVLAADWAVGQAVLSMLWFTLFFLWIWTAIAVFADIFRSRDLSGWGKALWILFVLVFPVLGVLVYLIARGRKMGEQAAEAAQAQDAAARQYIRETVAATEASTSSSADDLIRLTELRQRGVIDDAEFQRMKARIVR